jgi:hypothetical protein
MSLAFRIGLRSQPAAEHGSAGADGMMRDALNCGAKTEMS